MAAQKEVKVTKKQLEDSTRMWKNFTIVSKYTIYATILILVGLALAFVKLL